MASRILIIGLTLLLVSCTTESGSPTASTTQNAGVAECPPPDLRLWGVALNNGGTVWEHIGIENYSDRGAIVSTSILVDWGLSGKGYYRCGQWTVNGEVIRTPDEAYYPERYLILPSVPIYARNTNRRLAGEVIDVNIPLDAISKEVGDTSNLKDGRLTISVCLSIMEMDSAHQLHRVTMFGDLVHNWPAQAGWHQMVAMRKS